MDVKEFSHEMQKEESAKRGFRVKLGHIHQAVAAGFGYRTLAGMRENIAITGVPPIMADFKKAYYDARLKELLENEKRTNKKAIARREKDRA